MTHPSKYNPKAAATARRQFSDNISAVRRTLQQLHEQNSLTSETLKASFRDSLRFLAETIHRAASFFHQGDDAEQELDLYFWPGYDCFLGASQTPERLTISNGIDGMDGAKVGGGIGYCRVGGSAFYDIHSVFWYDRLLSPTRRHKLCGIELVPGGTHAWAAAPPQLEILLKTSPNQVPLRVLAIEVNDQVQPLKMGRTEGQSGPTHEGTLRIRVPLCDASRLEMGTLIGKYLDTAELFSPPHRRWPFRAGMVASDLQIEAWRQLYNLWIAATLAPNADIAQTTSTALLAKVESLSTSHKLYLQRYGDAPSSLADELAQLGILHHRQYSAWYTLLLPQWVATGPSTTSHTELGSAMLFSSRFLHEHFLHMTREWVERFYGMLRTIEQSFLLRQATRESTQKKGWEAQAHELTYITPLINSKTPAHLLTLVRQYFSILFTSYRVLAADDPEIDAQLPSGFTRGSTLSIFIENALRIAAEIQCMVAGAVTGTYPTIAQVARAVRDSTDYLRLKDETLDSIEPCAVWDMRQRWAFCSALVCAFRNVVQHRNREKRDIMISLEDFAGAQCLAIKNHGETMRLTTGAHELAAANFQANTFEAMRYYILLYMESFTSTLWKEDRTECTYTTWLPLPPKAHNEGNVR